MCTEGESELVNKLSKVKYIALGAIWILCLWLLISVSNTHDHPSFSSTSAGHVKFNCRKNYLGATNLIRRDPSQNGTMTSVVAFHSLTTENGRLGIFKTALQRTALVKDLKVDIRGDGSIRGVEYNPAQDFLGELANKLRSGAKSKGDYEFHLNVDFANISKLLVIGFQVNRFVDEALKLSIQSKIAETSHEESGLVLRGHVLIKTNSGKVLECNRVVWDVKEDIFKVNGVYALNKNGIIETGEDVCLDMNLNEIVFSQSTPNHRKEQQKCFAKSSY